MEDVLLVDSKFLLQAVGSAGFFAFAAVQSKLFKTFSLYSHSGLGTASKNIVWHFYYRFLKHTCQS